MLKSSRSLSRHFAQVAAVLVLVICALSACGWFLDSPLLMNVLPGFVSIKFNTALALTCFSMSLLLLSLPASRALKRTALLFSLIGFLVGFFTVCEYIFSWNAHIDQLIFADHAMPDKFYPPGRPAPVTAVSIVFIGFATWLNFFANSKHYRLGQIIFLAVGLISTQALIAYSLNSQTAFGYASHTRIAIQTAVGFVILCSGFLVLTHRKGYMHILLSSGVAGRMARQLAIAALLLPPLFNFIARWGEIRGYLETDSGTLLRAVAGTFFFTLIIWRTSEEVFNAHRAQIRSSRKLGQRENERNRLLIERKLSEARRRSELHLKAVFESAFSGIICIDRLGKIIDWNLRAEKIFGWCKEEVLGRDLVTTITPETHRLRRQTELHSRVQMEALSADHRPMEWQAQRKTGEVFPIHLALSEIALESGAIYTTFIEDISERKRAEGDLVRARQEALDTARLKSEFLANISHEIRTPLNGILGMTQILSNTSLTSDQRASLDTLDLSSRTLLSLVNQILDFSKSESGKMQLDARDFDLFSLIATTLSIVDFDAATKGLTLRKQIASDVPQNLRGDAQRLRQVLLNLINNAIKFTDQGEIEVRVSVAQHDPRPTLLFEVIDRGIGIAPETVGKLFQAFTQGDGSISRKFGGSGLGLAISKQLVEAMGGEIGVDSALSNGSRFYFKIPLTLSEISIDNSHNAMKVTAEHLGAKVLVAEDNKVNQTVVTRMAEILGCQCTVVSNGIEVIAALKEGEFDLILMDAQMPRMDGRTATTLIRQGEAGEKVRDIPIIATTANAFSGDLLRCLASGMNDYLSKPLMFQEVREKIKKWLSPAATPIDVSALAKLQELAAQGSPDLVAQIVQTFGVEAPQAILDLRRRLEQKERGIGKIAHGLRSTCASLGVRRMREITLELEQGEETGEYHRLAELVDRLEREYILAMSELKKYLIGA